MAMRAPIGEDEDDCNRRLLHNLQGVVCLSLIPDIKAHVIVRLRFALGLCRCLASSPIGCNTTVAANANNGRHATRQVLLGLLNSPLSTTMTFDCAHTINGGVFLGHIRLGTLWML